MYQQTVTVVNEMGLNGRFTGRFVQRAGQFQSSITMFCNGKEANGKKMIPICKLGAIKGSEVQIRAEGSDEQDAVECLTDMIRNAEIYSGDVKQHKQNGKKPGLLSLFPFFRRRQNQEDLSNEDQT